MSSIGTCVETPNFYTKPARTRLLLHCFVRLGALTKDVHGQCDANQQSVHINLHVPAAKLFAVIKTAANSIFAYAGVSSAPSVKHALFPLINQLSPA